MKLTTRYVVDGKDVTLLVYLKSADTMAEIMEELNVGGETTINCFTPSETCAKINDISTGYWKKSPKELARLFFEETKENPKLLDALYY